jgi:CubicO group peptidase (beta-lactamase class C family)
MANHITRRAALVRGAAFGTAIMLPGILGARAVAGASDSPLLVDLPLDRLVPQIEAAIAGAMTQYKVPGLSIALLRNGRTVWTRGFGIKNKDTAEPVDGDTVFEAASLTKPVFAYAVLALREQGRLDLDQPLATFLPQPYAEDDTGFLKQLTARHVLTHTTGLPNWLGRGGQARFLFRPGHKFSYSGEGFVYLQRVVERLTDAPLDEYLRKQLFEPLGMAGASLVWRDDFAERLAPGYGWPARNRGIVRKMPQPNAASSLVCTAADYARFVERMLADGEPAPGAIAVSDVKQMWQPRVEAADGVSWGLGIGIEHTPAGDAFWHWGNNGARYNGFVVGFPNHRLALVVLTNSGRGLKACTQVVPAAIGGDHPALRWQKVIG